MDEQVMSIDAENMLYQAMSIDAEQVLFLEMHWI